MAKTTSETIHVEGLPELARAFRKFEGDLGRKLRAELRAAGMIVAAQAKQNAAQQGLSDGKPPPGGGLITNVRVSTRRSAVYVRDTAKRVSPKYPSGYNYPARFEYENGGARSFIRPALDQKTDAIVVVMEALLTKLEREWETTR